MRFNTYLPLPICGTKAKRSSGASGFTRVLACLGRPFLAGMEPASPDGRRSRSSSDPREYPSPTQSHTRATPITTRRTNQCHAALPSSATRAVDSCSPKNQPGRWHHSWRLVVGLQRKPSFFRYAISSRVASKSHKMSAGVPLHARACDPKIHSCPPLPLR